MKIMLKNLTSSFFLKLVFGLFILKFLFDFYCCIKLDNIERLLDGTLNNVTYFLILYALGIIIRGKESKN